VIFEFIVHLRGGQEVWLGVEPDLEHIGEEGASQFRIDGHEERERQFAHRDSSERLSAAQQFAIDLADLL
jgi:hypothetical protein